MTLTTSHACSEYLAASADVKAAVLALAADDGYIVETAALETECSKEPEQSLTDAFAAVGVPSRLSPMTPCTAYLRTDPAARQALLDAYSVEFRDGESVSLAAIDEACSVWYRTVGEAFEVAIPEVVPERPSIEVAWTDKDGYAFTLVVDNFLVQSNTNLADAKPGEVDVSLMVSGSGMVTNMTPERNAPPQHISLHPAWPSDSQICSYSQSTMPIGNLRTGDDSSSGYCTLLAGPFMQLQPLEVNETAFIEFFPSGALGLEPSEFWFSFDESVGTTAHEEILNPSFWMVIGSENVVWGESTCRIPSPALSTQSDVGGTTAEGAAVCAQNPPQEG